MNTAVQKTVVISDSQIKKVSFVNWLANEVGSDFNRVRFSKFGETDETVVKYIDFSHADAPQRLIAVGAHAIVEPLLIPVLAGAKKVVFFITGQIKMAENCIDKLSASHHGLLRASPQVFVLFSDGGREQAGALETKLKKIKILPIYPELHTNDFRAIWNIISTNQESLAPAKDAALTQPDLSAEIANKLRVAKSAKPSIKQPMRVEMTQKPLAAVVEKKVTSTLEIEISEFTPAANLTSTPTLGDSKMATINDTLATLMTIDGAMGCFIADYTSGMVLAKAGAGVNLDIAAAGNTEVIKAKMKTMLALGLKESIEDILITLGTQYHIIRPLATKQGLFLYIVLDKAKSNLAMARFKLLDAEKALVV